MIKVITYGTYDMLHYGHIRLLERAKELGDYLIVGVTSDDYDKTRGKINLQQSLMERVEAVKATGIPDEVIVEEYEGQKIDDIKHYDVDIFTVGSDWVGYFDYLNEYCKVVYLDRTQGISSSELRAKENKIKLGIVGDEEDRILKKYLDEATYVNGLTVSGVCTSKLKLQKEIDNKVALVTDSFDTILKESDAIYLLSHPSQHYEQTKKALFEGKSVLVESPIALDANEYEELMMLAKEKNVVLMEALKTAYSTAYTRLLLLVKSGKIGTVVSVDAACTSIRDISQNEDYDHVWNSITAWGPTAFLPIIQILGAEYKEMRISSLYANKQKKFDSFTKVDFTYDSAVASARVGRGVKTEGDLIVSGTKGYIYVPAPWWKTDYFEVRYENPENNRRYYYQLEGEGIRNELVAFTRAVTGGKKTSNISKEESKAIAEIMSNYYNGDVNELK